MEEITKMNRVRIIILICLLMSSLIIHSKAQQLFGKNKNLLKYDNSWAILIGINDFKHWDDLDYALKDVEDIKKVLIEDYDFDERNIRVYLNKDVTLENVRILLWGDFINKIGENDRLFFFWAGHGATRTFRNGTEKGFLVPYDGEEQDEKNAYASYLSMEEMEQFSTNCAAKHILFLVDACYSGFAASTKGATVMPVESDATLSLKSRQPGRQIITAGKKGEKVLESPDWGHSAFTCKLLNGIKSPFFAADANNDGVISATELGYYLKREVSNLTNEVQTPVFANFEGNGEFIFIRPDCTPPSIPNGFKIIPVETNQPPLPPPPEFVKFHKADFIMGDTFGDGESNERPAHSVTVDDFYILDHEVTNEEYFEFVRETKSHFPAWMKSIDPLKIDYSCDSRYLRMKKCLTEPSYPVVGVSYEDAQAYCKWVGRKYRLTGRLPKEAEWEYVARRGGEAVKFPNGKDNLSQSDANLRDTGSNDQWAYTAPSGSFPADVNGIKDMAGNVWEWCDDVHSGYGDPVGSGKRVIRGGGYDAFAWQCRATKRLIIPFSKGVSNVGFRVVLTVPQN
ncbi:SUMF1/EgtB/PvdO family nonheme iron enzyme [candidate division KSB1 bacterium]|nr:SUMF1/EgtB/PvdO family nonheme iron enzyme [candidate division KSB1 bacterium]